MIHFPGAMTESISRRTRRRRRRREVKEEEVSRCLVQKLESGTTRMDDLARTADLGRVSDALSEEKNHYLRSGR